MEKLAMTWYQFNGLYFGLK